MKFFVCVHNTDMCLHKRFIYLFLQINGTVCISYGLVIYTSKTYLQNSMSIILIIIIIIIIIHPDLIIIMNTIYNNVL
jgi:hypothetical protein